MFLLIILFAYLQRMKNSDILPKRGNILWINTRVAVEAVIKERNRRNQELKMEDFQENDFYFVTNTVHINTINCLLF